MIANDVYYLNGNDQNYGVLGIYGDANSIQEIFGKAYHLGRTSVVEVYNNKNDKKSAKIITPYPREIEDACEKLGVEFHPIVSSKVIEDLVM